MTDATQNCEMRGAWCQMCGPAKPLCYTRCYIEDGVWKYVEGCPNAANNGIFGSVSLCAKGNAAPASLDASHRLLYPMKRVGPKGPGAQFERISWDEALDTIAETLLRQKKEFGPETFGILSPQFFAVLAGLGRRFLNVHGSPNYLHSAICHEQRTASAECVFGPGSAPGHRKNLSPAQLEKTDLLVLWGVNPENAGVNLGAIRKQLEAMKAGLKVIDIRPLCDPAASKADIWLPVRPGTDLALALAILHVICAEELYDAEFVRNWCYKFEDLREHVKQFSPEWAQLHCGIEANLIRKVARMIAAAKPCAITCGNGIGDQSRDGHWTMIVIQLIGAICGNFGKPGGGADWIDQPPLIRFKPIISTLSEKLPQSEEDKAQGWQAGMSKLVAPEFPRWYQSEFHREPSSSYFRGLMSVLTEDPYPMRALFAQSTNPLSATRQPKLVAQALEKIDFFFVMDLHYNPSCDYADIVLPAASQYECSQQIALKNFPEGSFLALGHKIVDPPGEAMGDSEFYLRLAKRMGYGDDFWHGEIDGYLREMLEPTGYSLEELQEAQEGIFIPREPRPASCNNVSPSNASSQEGEREPDYAALFSELPHGKIPCVNEVFGGKSGCHGEAALPYLPVYRGPAEGIAETPELAREYPYAFSDVHAHRLSNHSYYNDIAQLRRFAPEPWVKIHPTTAAAHGIADGDWVEVESPHGSCILQAQITEGVAPDVLMARRGWWQACPDLGIPGYSWEDGGAEVSNLYSGDMLHSDSFHSAHDKQTLVRIRKHEGSGPHIFQPFELE